MKTYKGLRAIRAALGLLLLALAPGHAAPLEGAEIDSEGQAIRGSKTYVDPTSGTRTVTEWDFDSEAE
jgi:hypothetical protein